MADPYPLAPASSKPTSSSSSSVGGLGRRSSNPPRIRRRNRLITSCLECRRRKLGCDKQQPCTNCIRFSRECVYLASGLDPAAQAKLAEIKEKIGTLERTLEKDVARRRSTSGSASGGRGQGDDEASGDELSEEERDFDPDPFAVEDVAYYDDADDDFLDLGIQLGKMRITERIGGYVRPKFTEELAAILGKAEKNAASTTSGAQRSSEQSADSYLAPGSEFIAPASNFFFPLDPRKQSPLHHLPTKDVADKLIAHYWEAVHVIAHVVHRHSFERQYELFWGDIALGHEPTPSFQAIVLATLLSATVSLSEQDVALQFGVSKQYFIDNFRQGTEAALTRANFLRTTKLETLQALVMYLIPLCRGEVSRAHSALTGMAIRLAECMGLHRDGSHYGLAALDIHVRRLVWFQLCILDMRTCEATGPRPCIRKDEYDTMFPLNVDDADFECNGNPLKDADYFTDMTITRIRFECNEMTRMIWVERLRVDRRKNSLTNLLGMVESFRIELEKKYFPMLDNKVPLHYMAAMVYGVISRRMHTGVLYRYSVNSQRPMPERLRNIMVGSGALVLEHAIAIETAPQLKPWAWIAGALQQYHVALLLLDAVFSRPPAAAEEARIWRSLDYVFEIPPLLNPSEKVRFVLSQLRDRTETYTNVRRMRAPTRVRQTSLPTAEPDSILTNVPPQQDVHRSPSVHSTQSGGSNFQVTNTDFAFSHLTSTAPGVVEGQYLSPLQIAPRRGSDVTGINIRELANQAGGSASPGLDYQADIDWSEVDRIYPPDIASSQLSIPPFVGFPGYSTGLTW